MGKVDIKIRHYDRHSEVSHFSWNIEVKAHGSSLKNALKAILDKVHKILEEYK